MKPVQYKLQIKLPQEFRNLGAILEESDPEDDIQFEIQETPLLIKEQEFENPFLSPPNMQMFAKKKSLEKQADQEGKSKKKDGEDEKKGIKTVLKEKLANINLILKSEQKELKKKYSSTGIEKSLENISHNLSSSKNSVKSDH